MTVAIMALLGAGAGAGTLLTRRAVAPRPPALDTVLAALGQRGASLSDGPPTGRTRLDRLGSAARGIVTTFGDDLQRHHQELELTGRTPERHALNKLLGATAGLLVPNVVGAALVVVGVAIPVAPVAMLSLATAAGGFLMPDFLLRDEAEARRRAFRHTLSSYLDLVNVLLAGGAGIETALRAAADAGDGWGYQTIRAELRRAQLTGQSPWDTFAQLDARLGINELAELAASVSLAGSHGARIRASLAAKADTLRGHQVAETEAAAEAATERMTVPVAVLLFGFLVFIAYPAVVQITSVTGPQP